MFQSYEPISDRSFARKHMPLIRKELERRGLDGFIVPHDDEYQNEYTPAYAERLMWATGFSGSAGSAIILQKSAAIFTDGRYTVQVRQQADGDFFEYVDISEKSPVQWLEENAEKRRPDRVRPASPHQSKHRPVPSGGRENRLYANTSLTKPD